MTKQMDDMNKQLMELQQMLSEQINKKAPDDFNFMTGVDENQLQQQIDNLQNELIQKEEEIGQVISEKNDIAALCKALKNEKKDLADAEEQLRNQIDNLEHANYRLQGNLSGQEYQNNELALKVKKLELKLRQLQIIKVKDYERQLGSMLEENINLKNRVSSGSLEYQRQNIHNPNLTHLQQRGPLL